MISQQDRKYRTIDMEIQDIGIRIVLWDPSERVIIPESEGDVQVCQDICDRPRDYENLGLFGQYLVLLMRQYWPAS